VLRGLNTQHSTEAYKGHGKTKTLLQNKESHGKKKQISHGKTKNLTVINKKSHGNINKIFYGKRKKLNPFTQIILAAKQTNSPRQKQKKSPRQQK